jgi:hypothetical protein
LPFSKFPKETPEKGLVQQDTLLGSRIWPHTQQREGESMYYIYKSELDASDRERRLKHYAQALTALKVRLKRSLN